MRYVTEHRRRVRPAVVAAALGALAAGLLAAGPATAVEEGRTHSAPVAIEELSAGWSVPWAIAWLPDGSALVTERDTHQIVRLGPGGERTVIGTVPGVVSGGDGGLLGLALSPHFAHDRTLFVFHTAENDNRVARLTYDGTALGGYEPIVTGIPKATFHNGGQLAFGPDGYLYVSTGDALQPELSQDLGSLAGKILRLTPDGRPAPTNPFGSLVYSYGHRVAHGLAWDEDGRLWSAENGQDTFDELNIIRKGRNYGWPVCEGPCAEPGMTDPLLTWAPPEAVPAGLTYTDDTLYMSSLRGQRLWRIPLDGDRPGRPEAYYTGEFGRLRAISTVPGGGALWLGNSNADQVGQQPGADSVFEVTLGAR
ncbi:PQQ-dependent sugar dehydrogenase [Streptomyces litchfieldiae]|uniref:PQQ-dependent sugar dehydrogenase n=1 Tax=Streptomyces litchfieldiae TaxID=3075543 RepID=A0ABU2MLH2_9ACTN|nr:PQQ-dependent sugar dehydrogenase [Streptomyces sp. DSM 44938]MDT0342454.1 PQQ-dependent sugar dehydrogenase [Streptomyces sp. DSM 44938]